MTIRTGLLDLSNRPPDFQRLLFTFVTVVVGISVIPAFAFSVGVFAGSAGPAETIVAVLGRSPPR